MVLSQRFLAHGDTLVNLALENRGIFQVEVYDEGDGREGKKGPYPTKSTILNNFVNLRASQKLCPGALLAFFGA